jgi:hypothetical protein
VTAWARKPATDSTSNRFAGKQEAVAVSGAPALPPAGEGRQRAVAPGIACRAFISCPPFSA